ncbi:UDP-N-acetylmuramoyl-L-alanyl-D-glutamate--2,6-diaminopimelate ligase [Herminiimonas sp. CN]|uniref:UDP-N-acetylmuramoyl-L-alanyl-D-glutamate--2, 6-diaminopimelate ligase n=1 Tax=Herminiimonas sp. CN TaxID=1349818 RepID=UPI0004737AD9|nr:UDP-N-acetylmuramoyl-L-alanyl-D-glutamate--2,6-diaminopimelate ligase [Herminiimonas sp. CN]
MPNTQSSTSKILAWLQRQVASTAQLHSDSRSIAKGDVFFAYPGDAADGREFIAQAIQMGAGAVVHESSGWNWDAGWSVPHLGVFGLKNTAGEIASAYYSKPDAGMFTVAVTGTNGKTSCTQWLANALSRLGEPVAVIGTLGIGIYQRGTCDTSDMTGYTTPDAVMLQRRLAQLRAAGVHAVAIEASSIGLEQGRLNGMHFDAAIFTNLTRDHLDYHGDMAAYESAKTALFDWDGLQHAIVNLDDPMGLRLAQRLQGRTLASLIGYTVCDAALEGISTLRAFNIRSSHAGTAFQVESPFGSGTIRTQLVGLFNVSNVLGVLGALLVKGTAWRAAVQAIELLTAVPGRMQQLGGNDAPLVVIDYAHTPDALEKTLLTLRQVAQQRHGQLWCLFGCGGDRDPGKRAQMGAVSALADQVVVTSDNPRSENPAAIIEQIMAGLAAEKTPHHVTEDRAAAILWAVKHAAKHDVVLLAGKGHEAYQEVMGKKLAFSDADHAALALAARATMKGGA